MFVPLEQEAVSICVNSR